MSIQVPRGTVDLLPEDTSRLHYLENILHTICDQYNYAEIRTPIFEHTELFLRGVGETTDIVQKEMYTFKDRGDRSLTLRPEGTAPVVRAYVEHKLHGLPQQPQKLYYHGPMFRYERPQAGRQRQFTQFGIEVIGSHDAAADVEVIALAWDLFQRLGIKNVDLEINSVGCSTCRPSHREALQAFLAPRKEELCKECQSRFDRNPMRILDCKSDRCQEIVAGAPSILDHLCGECNDQFDQVKVNLDQLGIAYEINPNMVRGLDYYTRTAFEFMEGSIGAKSTICGGGRYNGMVQEMGGPDQPGVGFGLGIERLILAIETQKIDLPIDDSIDFYVIALGETPQQKRLKIVQDLRRAGYRVDTDYMDRKMKAQLRAADRNQAKYVLILGEDELNKGIIAARNLSSGEQVEVSLDLLVETCQELVHI